MDAPTEPRLSIASKAMASSQLNGGGCIPPPLPPGVDRHGKTLASAMLNQLQVAQRYNSKRRTVDPTYMTTTQAMMAGQTITQTDLAAIPSDTSKMGSRVMGGSLEILPHARRTGNLALYETSSMAQSAQVYGDRALS